MNDSEKKLRRAVVHVDDMVVIKPEEMTDEDLIDQQVICDLNGIEVPAEYQAEFRKRFGGD